MHFARYAAARADAMLSSFKCLRDALTELSMQVGMRMALHSAQHGARYMQHARGELRIALGLKNACDTAQDY